MLTESDRRFAAEALNLARSGWGRASPNPMVGAIVVRDGRVVGRGYHAEYGGPHAESAALDVAGDAGRGSTLYCSLEPCCYQAPEKHQPPCTGRIIAAGVSRVVINQIDPNPRVSGRGVKILRSAGIDVDLLGDQEPAWVLNDAFNTAVTLRRPFVHLKMAQSLDGRIATAGGESRWITGETARSRGHVLRRGRDAVLIGVGTANADDPSLTVRLAAEGGNPLPVVVDPSLRISLHSFLVTHRASELILLADAEASCVRRSRLEAQGVRVRVAQRGDDGLPVLTILNSLWKEGIRSVLVEGGSRVHGYFLRSGLFDRVSLFVSPRFIGAAGTPTVDCLNVETLSDAIGLERVSLDSAGEDVVVDGYRRGWLAETQSATQLETQMVETQEAARVHRIS